MKGLAASNKRSKFGSQKLKIKFSRLGGHAGENTRTFTDEIVVFTRKRAPLIGVRTWRDVHQDVKDSIIYDIMVSFRFVLIAYTFFLPNFLRSDLAFMFYVDQNKWDIENNVENKKKIWTIANERYKGWRSTLSATYKAYATYDERMGNKPEDLDIVEWHYLVLYFGSEEFQV